MVKYISPSYNAKAFTCPHCGAYAGMEWRPLHSIAEHYPVSMATCAACGKSNFWRVLEKVRHQLFVQGQLMWPRIIAAPPAHPDLPDELRVDVEEARLIAGHSPRGAAALLRLVIEKLVTHLGAKGKDTNAMIGDLVAKGLPERIQKALDSVRVIGNNAVHAGKMDQEDVAETVGVLFTLVNMIVEDQITQAKQLDAVFDALPVRAKEGIEKRDAPKPDPA